MSDKRVESIKNIDMSDLKFPMAAVHVSPLDYPGKVIARIFDMDKPTNTVIVRNSLEEVMEDIRSNSNMVFIQRGADDVKSLVGVWM